MAPPSLGKMLQSPCCVVVINCSRSSNSCFALLVQRAANNWNRCSGQRFLIYLRCVSAAPLQSVRISSRCATWDFVTLRNVILSMFYAHTCTVCNENIIWNSWTHTFIVLKISSKRGLIYVVYMLYCLESEVQLYKEYQELIPFSNYSHPHYVIIKIHCCYQNQRGDETYRLTRAGRPNTRAACDTLATAV